MMLRDSMKSQLSFWAVLLSVPLLFLASVPLIALSGWVLSVLWAWFVVPLGVPAIGVAHAYGIMLIYGFFNVWKSKVDAKKEKKKGEDSDEMSLSDIWGRALAQSIGQAIGLMILLGIARIVLAFM